MRNPFTFLDDLQILLKIFQLPGAVLIYDPNRSLGQNSIDGFKITDRLNDEEFPQSGKTVLVNISNEKVKSFFFKSFDFILDFRSKPQNLEGFNAEIFYFINSPNGTMRWIFPKELKHPGFLSLYNSSGLRASIFQQVVKLAYQTQTHHLISSGKLVLYSKREKYVHQLYAAEDQSFSIFTGTVGPNRKVIIALHQGKTTTNFIKVPLTENATFLVNNEWNHLRCLGQFQFKHIEVPKVEPLPAGIMLSNIKPRSHFHVSELQKLHFSALSELYDQTTRYCKLSSILTWNQSLDDIFYLFTNFKESEDSWSMKIRKMIGNLYELSQYFDEHVELPIAYSHGDFTPWNMYLDKDRLYVYDWELASLHRPMLFDLFHFIFQTHVLIRRSSFQEIIAAIRKMRKHPSVRRLIGKYDIDFDLHYQLYLFFNCAYYIKLYIIQKRIHKQAVWLIDCWLDAFKELSAQKNRLTQSSRA